MNTALAILAIALVVISWHIDRRINDLEKRVDELERAIQNGIELTIKKINFDHIKENDDERT